MFPGGLEVVGDLTGQYVGRGEVVGVLQALVLEPEDVEAHLVTGEELVVAEGPPAAVGVLLAPGRLPLRRLTRLVDRHKLVKIGPLERIGLLGEVHVRPQVVDPQLLRPGLLLGRLAVEKEDVRLHPLGVENPRREPQERVAVELPEKIPPDRLPCPALEEDVVGHHHRTAAVHLEERLDVLDEVKLLIFCRRPEILPLVGMLFLLEVPLLVDDRDAALLPEGGIGEDHAVALAGVVGQAIDARLDRARIGVYAVEVEIHDAQAGRVGHDLPAMHKAGPQLLLLVLVESAPLVLHDVVVGREEESAGAACRVADGVVD